MLQTDNEGYANVKWPSKNVPYGGILHVRKATISPEDTQFIKVLLNEQKQTILQKNTAWKLREFDLQQPVRYQESSSKYLAPEFRIAQCGKRTLASIRKSGDLDIDTFNPNPRGVNRDELKRRLQDMMEFGPRLNLNKIKMENQQPPKCPLVPLTPRQYRSELISQIRERMEWLEDMEKLGEAENHRSVINGQINERLREIKALGLDDSPRKLNLKQSQDRRSLLSALPKSPGKKRDASPFSHSVTVESLQQSPAREEYQNLECCNGNSSRRLEHAQNSEEPDNESVYEFVNNAALRKTMQQLR